METSALHEPLDFEVDACVDERVEVGVGVFQGQSVRVDEHLGDGEMDLGGQRHEGEARGLFLDCTEGRDGSGLVHAGAGGGAARAEKGSHRGAGRSLEERELGCWLSGSLGGGGGG